MQFAASVYLLVIKRLSLYDIDNKLGCMPDNNNIDALIKMQSLGP